MNTVWRVSNKGRKDGMRPNTNRNVAICDELSYEDPEHVRLPYSAQKVLVSCRIVQPSYIKLLPAPCLMNKDRSESCIKTNCCTV